MTYRKIVNRMRKAQKETGDRMTELAQVGGIGVLDAVRKDPVLHNICVEAYNVHVVVWNRLQRYIDSLNKKEKP